MAIAGATMRATTTFAAPARAADTEADSMDHEREHTEDEATSVDEPTGRASDHDTPYDPAMTDGDEANIPPESDTEPEAPS